MFMLEQASRPTTNDQSIPISVYPIHIHASQFSRIVLYYVINFSMVIVCSVAVLVKIDDYPGKRFSIVPHENA